MSLAVALFSEVISTRLQEVVTLRNPERSAQIARWLLAHNVKDSIVETYAKIRGTNMVRTLNSVKQQDNNFEKSPNAVFSSKSSVSLRQ